jgi:ATP-binding cassette subfamily B protein
MNELREEIAWPVSRLNELVENLAESAGLLARQMTLPQAPASLSLASDAVIGRWLDAGVQGFGLEAEMLRCGYAEVEQLIQRTRPLILNLPADTGKNPARLVGVLSASGSRVKVLLPSLRTRWVRLEWLRSLLCEPLEKKLVQEVNLLLEQAGTPETVRKRARRAILVDQLSSLPILAGWVIRQSPGARLAAQLSRAKLAWPVSGLFLVFLAQQIIGLAGWIILGRGVFNGQFDWTWMIAWVLLLLSAVPLGMMVSDFQAEISLATGSIFKQRLLYGILNLKPDEIRHLGMGQFLGRVMESEAIELLAFSGGFTAMLALVELGLAFYVLRQGALGGLHTALLLAWSGVIFLLIWRNFHLNRQWSQAYRQVTNEMVENMVGHRTRLVQEKPDRWHEREDQGLSNYLKLSEKLDRSNQQISSLAARGWLILGLGALGLVFIPGGASAQQLAISLGGVIFASQAFQHLVNGAQSLAAIQTAWDQVGPLFNAADRPVETASPEWIAFPANLAGRLSPEGQGAGPAATPGTAGPDLLLARHLVYRYRPGGRAVIDDASLDIHPGERILLEGPSGGGKSTLAALLTGLREPESGSLLLWGVDRRITGSLEWRRRVAMAPQFQENYVFSETLGFNLLMGRRWPATQEDLEEAEDLLKQLGLGEVFERMPSGFQQMLGESGWQLSHGERSRLYIARTLLQGADLIILDESFAALDPENLFRSLNCVLQRAPTLVVIAHP